MTGVGGGGAASLEDLHRNYTVAFLRYLPRREEVALHTGYLLGRDAVTQGVSLLELARIHHEALSTVLRDVPVEDLTVVIGKASEFFLEVLGPFDMAQRGLLDS